MACEGEHEARDGCAKAGAQVREPGVLTMGASVYAERPAVAWTPALFGRLMGSSR